MATLFVGRDRERPQRLDLGSVLCAEIAEFAPDVAVVHCTAADRPGWVTGTPTLTVDGAQYRGHAAFSALLQLALRHAADAAAAAAPPAASRQRGVASRPSVRLRPETAKHEAAEEGDATHDDPAKSPPDEDAAEDDLWREPVAYDDEDEDDRRLTGDDLSRAVEARKRPPA